MRLRWSCGFSAKQCAESKIVLIGPESNLGYTEARVLSEARRKTSITCRVPQTTQPNTAWHNPRAERGRLVEGKDRKGKLRTFLLIEEKAGGLSTFFFVNERREA